MADKEVFINVLVTQENIENKEYICNEPDCLKNLKSELSLKKHISLIHNAITSTDKSLKVIYQYWCPIQSCRRKNDSFSSRKYLIQHFFKAHNSEKFSCSSCEKRFSTELLRNVHEKSCGKIFSCNFCNCCYNSNEALITHRKRKSHFDPSLELEIKKKKQKIEKSVGTVTVVESKATATDDALLALALSKSSKNSSTSTSDNFMKEENSNSLSSSSSQNKKANVSWSVNEFEENSSNLFDSAETQTDFNESIFGNNFMNNFTQTTFSDFDFSFEKFDSQTQTNWDEF